VNDEIRFELVPDEANNVTHLTTVKFNHRTSWHVVSSFIIFFGDTYIFQSCILRGEMIDGMIRGVILK
jgi:hypothetical protein